MYDIKKEERTQRRWDIALILMLAAMAWACGTMYYDTRPIQHWSTSAGGQSAEIVLLRNGIVQITVSRIRGTAFLEKDGAIRLDDMMYLYRDASHADWTSVKMGPRNNPVSILGAAIPSEEVRTNWHLLQAAYERWLAIRTMHVAT